jgi:hypothetical protein
VHRGLIVDSKMETDMFEKESKALSWDAQQPPQRPTSQPCTPSS